MQPIAYYDSGVLIIIHILDTFVKSNYLHV